MHKPTEQTKALVSAMVVNGVPQADVAKVLKLDPKTLRKCYREALDHGKIILCARVARNLGKIATTGHGAAAVSACRYILGCKAGWRDVSRLEVEPSQDALTYFSGLSDAREIIAEKLDALERRNTEIDVFNSCAGVG